MFCILLFLNGIKFINPTDVKLLPDAEHNGYCNV